MLCVQRIKFTRNRYRSVSIQSKIDILIYKRTKIKQRQIKARIASDLLNMTSNQPPSNWKLETGYSDRLHSESYPYRIYNTGPLASLKAILRVAKNDTDAMCSGGIEGFTIVFHPPNEFPQVEKDFLYVSLGKTVTFTVRPEQIQPQKQISAYSPDKRYCFYHWERRLQFFQEYTQPNCELECLSNFTLAECGCVKFSMPRRWPFI